MNTKILADKLEEMTTINNEYLDEIKKSLDELSDVRVMFMEEHTLSVFIDDYSNRLTNLRRLYDTKDRLIYSAEFIARLRYLELLAISWKTFVIK